MKKNVNLEITVGYVYLEICRYHNYQQKISITTIALARTLIINKILDLTVIVLTTIY